jgi:hypothetical protein
MPRPHETLPIFNFFFNFFFNCKLFVSQHGPSLGISLWPHGCRSPTAHTASSKIQPLSLTAQLNLNLEVSATYTRSISWHQKQRGRSNTTKLSPLISPLLVAIFRISQSLPMVSHAPKNLASHLQLKSLRYDNS